MLMKKGETRSDLTQYNTKQRINLSGAINHLTGESFVMEIPKGESSTFVDFLICLIDRFSNYSVIHLYVDGIPFHRSPMVMNFLATLTTTKVVLHRLPRYAPNKNPIERLWKKLKTSIKNHMFKTKNQCLNYIKQYFKELSNDKKTIMKLCKV